MPHNPKWSRDELVLALDLYLQRRDKIPGVSDPEVIAVSELLQKMAGPAASAFKRYRSADAVAMKLSNFQSIDPRYTSAGKKGLPAGAKGDREVWRDFSTRPSELHDAALALKAIYKSGNVPAPLEEEEDEEEALEGRVLTRLHKYRERDKKLVKQKKAKVLKAAGKLACEACSFEFQSYGERGVSYIEAHHMKPVHELRPGDKTRLEDLALLCANCHRMVHRKRPWLTLAELKKIAPDWRRG